MGLKRAEIPCLVPCGRRLDWGNFHSRLAAIWEKTATRCLTTTQFLGAGWERESGRPQQPGSVLPSLVCRRWVEHKRFEPMGQPSAPWKFMAGHRLLHESWEYKGCVLPIGHIAESTPAGLLRPFLRPPAKLHVFCTLGLAMCRRISLRSGSTGWAVLSSVWAGSTTRCSSLLLNLLPLPVRDHTPKVCPLTLSRAWAQKAPTSKARHSIGWSCQHHSYPWSQHRSRSHRRSARASDL